ncbi:serine-rich protein [Grosmannia clavigera kw1407]|uniref:Serine-rich protein n=1 Tax=Grosmannia clavigera (strain kw1407 / UAMH 11150) TaxID=655863 RepID=F0XPQ9_GROCL|nr:serine-rich protein [Grosmannia clavigera kw1407]EFX00486.1 serine-rich protein [Grosmannia clavigera kw1407]
MNESWHFAADRPAGVRSSGTLIYQDDESASEGPAVASDKADDMVSTDSPKRRRGRRTAPSPLPLHERTPSQNNRMSGIRVVPYSPARIAADAETRSIAASSSSSTRIRLFLAKDDGDANEDTDSTRTKQAKRISRGSWGSLIAATAAAAVNLASPLLSRTPSRTPSRTGSIRTLSGRFGKKTAAATGDTTSEPGSVVSTPIKASRSPLANSGTNDVSGPKRAVSPTENANWTTLLHSPVRASGQLPLDFPDSQLSQDGRDDESVLALPQEYDQSPAPSSPESTLPASAAYAASPSSALADLPLPPNISSTGFSPLSPSASVTSLVSVSSSQLTSRPSSRPGSRRHKIAVHSDKTFSLVPLASVAASSNASLATDPTSFLRSPPLTFSSPTLRSTVSNDRLSSNVFSSVDFNSSFLSTNPTAHDRSSLTSFAPSFSSSFAHFSGGSAKAKAKKNDTSSLDDSLPGGLRQVPTTPELKPKGKGKGRAVSPKRSHRQLAYHSYLPQLSAAGNSIILLPALAEALPIPASAGTTSTADNSAAASSANWRPRKKTSFGSEQSAGALSTISSLPSANTNYEIYAHSPSLVPHDSSDSLGFVPSSTGSFSDLGNTTNIEIHERSSPVEAAPPLLPVLRRNIDPDQTFTTVESYEESIDQSPNIVVFGASSPPTSLPFRRPALDERSSEAHLSSSPPYPPHTAETEDSEPNYVLYSEPSPPQQLQLPQQPQQPQQLRQLQQRQHPFSSSSVTSSVAAASRQLWRAYSQESLVVRPLQPARKQPSEQFGYFKSRSRESLRHAASIKSISSVILNQETASVFFAGQAFLNLAHPPVPVFSATKRGPPVSITTTVPRRKPVSRLAPPIEDRVRERTLTPSMWSPSATSSGQRPQRSAQVDAMAEEHAHQWSSQLSTVMSESEAESRRLSHFASRSRSRSRSRSGSASAHGRRSSIGWAASSSSHSRNMPSISSSLALQLDEARSHRPRSDPLLPERPQPAYGMPRTTVVRDQDEHGDGLADLHDVMLWQSPSRSAISGFFSSSNSSSRNLHSSGSSRSINSPIPAWARVYYGSGERKYLATSVSDGSMCGDSRSRRGSASSSRPGSMFRRSPSVDRRTPMHIYNARRRPRERKSGGPAGERPFSDAASMEMGEGGEAGAGGVLVPGQYRVRGLRKITSSLWSPHLGQDRRAARFTVWDPPSVSWSAETGSRLSRRSTQIAAFTVGFIFPFAWMVAAFLPLPPDPQRAMEKQAESEFGVPEVLKQRITQADEVRFQSTRWWRTLNRCMSVLGLLILGAVIALIVVGVQQHWAQ